jgi:eukaryotic-like serine/threonine-protein kinase
MWFSGVTLGQRYELEERVGAGGFSEVWRARDLILDRSVAAKVLHGGYPRDAEARARFRAEARHAGSLAHENIARVYDYGEPDPPYLVMELVEGPSLHQVLASGPVDAGRAMDVVAQAAAGLQAAHEAGLVHRDIKPANLLLAPDGVVKVTDFGISHAVGSAGVTSTGLIVGTPAYLAPERVDGARGTPLSDLYSLGVVAYECLAGEPPFTGTALEVALAHARRPFPALPAFVPPDVAALVTHLTARNPADRPGTAAEVACRARQLSDRLASGSSLVASTSGRLPAQADEPRMTARPAAAASRERSSRPRRLAATGGVAAVLLGLVVLIGTNIGGPEAAGHPAAAPSPAATGPKVPAVVTVDVDISSLIGQPVSAVVFRLRQQGLIPRVLWQPSDQQPPGRVTAIWPAGHRPVGSLVTVVGALPVPATAGTSQQASKPAGNENGSSTGKGKGKGKGNGNGNGKGNGKG